jgi:hypothetical protein
MANQNTHPPSNNLQGRECNIKTLNTIDTIDIKNYKTKNYDISSAFARDDVTHANLAANGTSFSSGRASLSAPEVLTPTEGTVSHSVSAEPEISYLSASLKNPKTERRTLNIDFRLTTTPAGKFNKLVFSLVDKSRSREFLANIDPANHNDWEYQQALETFVMSNHKDKWIGKGRSRGIFNKEGKHINQKVKIGTSATLELTPQGYVANIWIDNTHKQFLLSPVDNARYPFRYDSKTSME